MRALLFKYKTNFNPTQILYKIHVKSRYVIKDFCYRNGYFIPYFLRILRIGFLMDSAQRV